MCFPLTKISDWYKWFKEIAAELKKRGKNCCNTLHPKRVICWERRKKPYKLCIISIKLPQPNLTNLIKQSSIFLYVTGILILPLVNLSTSEEIVPSTQTRQLVWGHLGHLKSSWKRVISLHLGTYLNMIIWFLPWQVAVNQTLRELSTVAVQLKARSKVDFL